MPTIRRECERSHRVDVPFKSFYHKVTGLFHARHLMSSDARAITLNTPHDHIALDGDHFDRLSQRMDVKTGMVVDQVPVQPSVDHEWNICCSIKWAEVY